jgi:hypothetical protein
MREWVYGVGHPIDNESIYLHRYRNHNQEILSYFKKRKEDLLVVDWNEDHQWETICSFLNAPIPTAPFPHANKGNYWLSFKNHQLLIKTKASISKWFKNS